MTAVTVTHKVAREFSRAAASYDDLALVQQRIAAAAIALLPTHDGQLLDIGCGTGKNTAQLARLGFDAQGVDLAPGMVDYARRQYAHLTFSVGDAQRLPFANQAFDCVFSSMALQWCANVAEVMAQIYRVLKPGGTAALTIMNDGSFFQLNNSRQACYLPVTTNMMASHEQWLRGARKTGFDVVEAKNDEYVDTFDDVLALLRSIKSVGAGFCYQPHTGRTLSRQDLKALNVAYQRFATPAGKLPLSYFVSHFILEK